MMLPGAPYPANASSLPKATQLLSSRAGKMEAMTPSQRLPDYTPPHTRPLPRPGLAPLSSAWGSQPPGGLNPSRLALCQLQRSPDPHHHPLCSISVVPSPAPPSPPLWLLHPSPAQPPHFKKLPPSFSKPCTIWGLSLRFSRFMIIPGSPSPLGDSSP